MRTVEKTVYPFNELSDRAKERARDWFRQGDDFAEFHGQTVIDDAARLADMFGLDIRQKTVRLMNGGTRQEPEVYYSGFSSQGDGASFAGNYSYKRGSVRAVEKEAPSEWDGKPSKSNAELNRIVRELAEVQRKNFYQLQASIRTRNRDFGVAVDVERADDKPVSDEDAETVRELMNDFANWIYRQLEREYEYQNSDDVVDENITANEYEFDEDGNRA